ncbi:TetR/AcrR family transcriptional regulator [Actinospica sp.]|jgi:AcrR family transcriptional regulator|uniref:TetR/AcrR family transcriptional regulator n=1 Tax=Actinospica sp. TaxID=1872142 RepID=UPI002CE8C858|nr:TetR/AcrR family transcriptional regulator [Actinospica sp.]HWG25654.1 TetR/AcrR family transcriptional regulator [Actinospica sp.]
MSLRERRKQQTRKLLTDTATELFLAKGFDAVRVVEIAEACGVSEKTVYNYFPTKEALLLDHVEALPDALRTALGDHATPPVTAVLGVLAEELGALIGRIASEPDFGRAREQTRRFGALIRSTPSLRAYQHEETARMTTMAAELLAPRFGGDPEALAAAHALLGLWPVQYASLRRHLETASGPEDLHAAVTADVRRAAELIERGLGPAPGG